MWWIGLHLPLLSLEAHAAGLPAAERDAPLALLAAGRIAAANVAARQLGVQPGQQRATALALAPRLRLGLADAVRDAQALTSVAHAALAFTPAVSLAPPQTVLLEVQASLRCFGGRDALLERLRAELAPLGHQVCLACAPTAQGAALLAHWVHSAHSADPRPVSPGAPAGALHAADLAALRALLAGAPLGLLGAGREHREALQAMGLRRVGELQRLPRAGLARRFGEALLDELDRALGRKPDPRDWVVPPPVFESRLELFARADSSEQLLQGAGLLLARLIAWAAARHARVRSFTLVMLHETRRRPPADGSEPPARSELRVALAEPSRDLAHLLALLRERLGRLQLAAPTLDLLLRCADVAPGAPPAGELFPTPASEREGLTRLVERLQARLGREQVRRLVPVADHRPEQANLMRPAEAAVEASARRDATAAALPVALRPVWLLPQLLPLRELQHLPLFDGAPLELLCGPERIESGWWDGALAERDYYVAQTAEGALLWVFRTRRSFAVPGQPAPGWYLQGRFG